MSHKINVENLNGYLGMEYSSGDSKKMKSKQFYQEENNNEVDELSKNFSEMGCIVDVVKRPPNICVETCVYEEESDNENNESEHDDNEDINYSDEFEEEDLSEEKEEPKNKTVLNINNSKMNINKSCMKLTKSQTTIASPKPLSGRSLDYGSISVPQTRRVNMSFTNERLREIERHNHILLNKILSARNNQKSSIPPREQGIRRPVPSAAVHRKMQQKKIDHDNMILLKKIQRVKSTACSIRR